IEPATLYNIWVVLDVNTVLLCYGNFPKTKPTHHDIRMDGFVYFTSPAPYDLHFTAIHETGHWFAINHPFCHDANKNDYDDNVDDTPYQTAPDFGNVWEKSAPWPSSEKNGYTFYHGLPNFMNYVDDSCMFM